MADLSNKTNYFIYDSDNLLQTLFAKFLSGFCTLNSFAEKKVFFISYKDLLPGYAGLKDEDFKNRFIFIVDFDLDDDFIALDSSFQSNISDKRVYYDKDALNHCLLYLKHKEFFTLCFKIIGV